MEHHTPQTSHILESNSAATTTVDDTQSSNIKTNHNPLSTNTLISECTPSSTSQTQPITLFKTQDKSSPSNSSESPPESPPSNDTDEEVEDILHDTTVDGDSNSEQTYQTKAAKLIERSLGKISEFGRFERLRAIMKSKMHKKKKPTTLEKNSIKR